MKHAALLVTVVTLAACGDTGPLGLAHGLEPSWAIGSYEGIDPSLRPVEHASGTAHHFTAQGLKTLSFTATEAVDGTAVGQIEIFARGIREAHYAVACIDVVGNAAYIAGTATEVRRSPGSEVGEPFVFAVWDWGEGVHAPPDQATRGRVLADQPIELICNDLSGYAQDQTPYDVLRGNVQVMSWGW